MKSFWASLIDIWQFFSGHTGHCPGSSRPTNYGYEQSISLRYLCLLARNICIIINVRLGTISIEMNLSFSFQEIVRRLYRVQVLHDCHHLLLHHSSGHPRTPNRSHVQTRLLVETPGHRSLRLPIFSVT